MNSNDTKRRRNARRRGLAKLDAAYSHLCKRQDRNPIDGYVCDVDVDAYRMISRAMDRVLNATRNGKVLIMTIEILTAELVHRERAAGHLRGIPRQQNETAIAKLYDRLNALHIARIETSGNAPIWPA